MTKSTKGASPKSPTEKTVGLPDIRIALKASGLSHWAWKGINIPAALSPDENASELHSLMLDRAAELVMKVLQTSKRESCTPVAILKKHIADYEGRITRLSKRSDGSVAATPFHGEVYALKQALSEIEDEATS